MSSVHGSGVLTVNTRSKLRAVWLKFKVSSETTVVVTLCLNSFSYVVNLVLKLLKLFYGHFIFPSCGKRSHLATNASEVYISPKTI